MPVSFAPCGFTKDWFLHPITCRAARPCFRQLQVDWFGFFRKIWFQVFKDLQQIQELQKLLQLILKLLVDSPKIFYLNYFNYFWLNYHLIKEWRYWNLSKLMFVRLSFPPHSSSRPYWGPSCYWCLLFQQAVIVSIHPASAGRCLAWLRLRLHAALASKNKSLPPDSFTYQRERL